MTPVARSVIALLIGGLVGAAVSLAVTSTSSNVEAVSTQSSGAMQLAEVRAFPSFPLYGLEGISDLPFAEATRVTTEILARDARGVAPIQTIGVPPNSPESRGHRMVPDFVDLWYGRCAPPTGSDACDYPVNIQIWRSCNRFVDDYELAPGTPYPHKELMIRGARAAEFDGDRLEVYAGSVTIVIFADPSIAHRVADALVPLNEPAKVEMATVKPGELPATNPGPECV